MDCDYCIQWRVESLRSESQVYWQPHDILLQAILLNANINDWKIDWNHTKCKICQMGCSWQSIVFSKLLFDQNCIMQVCDKDERLIEMVHSARWAQWAHPYCLGWSWSSGDVARNTQHEAMQCKRKQHKTQHDALQHSTTKNITYLNPSELNTQHKIQNNARQNTRYVMQNNATENT